MNTYVVTTTVQFLVVAEDQYAASQYVDDQLDGDGTLTWTAPVAVLDDPGKGE